MIPEARHCRQQIEIVIKMKTKQTNKKKILINTEMKRKYNLNTVHKITIFSENGDRDGCNAIDCAITSVIAIYLINEMRIYLIQKIGENRNNVTNYLQTKIGKLKLPKIKRVQLKKRKTGEDAIG